MITEADYRRAVEEPAYRQEFLDSIDMEDARPYVSRVVYCPNQRQYRSTLIMQTNVPFLSLLGIRRLRYDVIAFPFAFTLPLAVLCPVL